MVMANSYMVSTPSYLSLSRQFLTPRTVFTNPTCWLLSISASLTTHILTKSITYFQSSLPKFISITSCSSHSPTGVTFSFIFFNLYSSYFSHTSALATSSCNCLNLLLWNYRFSLPASSQDLDWSFSPILHTKEQSRDIIQMEQKSENIKKYIPDS